MFIQILAKGKTGAYRTLVALDHIANLIEATGGCQLVMKSGDILVVDDDFDTVKGLIGSLVTVLEDKNRQNKPKMPQNKAVKEGHEKPREKYVPPSGKL